MATKKKKSVKAAKAKARPAKKPVKKTAPKKTVAKKKATKPVRVAAPMPTKSAARATRSRKSLLRRAGEAALRAMPRLSPKLGGKGKYDADLDRNTANFQSLTPLTFLERAASVFPDRTAIIHGKQRFSYTQYYARARRLASALHKAGLRKGASPHGAFVRLYANGVAAADPKSLPYGSISLALMPRPSSVCVP